MTRIREQWALRRRELNWIVVYALIVGLLSILLDVASAFDGELVAISRLGVAILGMVGAVILWYTPGGQLGWSIMVVWAAVQVPMIAWSTLGSPTEQFFAFPLGYTSKTTVDGVVTEYQQYRDQLRRSDSG